LHVILVALLERVGGHLLAEVAPQIVRNYITRIADIQAALNDRRLV
jgi:uncharacterized membrane protein